jgi:hypothetical protein
LSDLHCQGLEVPLHNVIRRIPVFLCIPVFLLLCGCWNGSAMLLFEQPHWDTLGNPVVVTTRLAAGALWHGYLPSILVVPAALSPLDQLVRTAGSMRRGAVVVGPLLSYEWGSFAARFPGVHFILVGDIPPAEVPPNVLVLTYDRSAAFRSAGETASRAARAAGGHVAVLTSGASDLVESETAAFAAGASSGGQEAPVVLALPASPDKATVQSAVGDLHRAGAEVILLGLGSLDAWGLEVMKGTGGRAVLADWRSSGAYPGVVLLSVEEDVPGGVAKALRALSRGERGAAGPVRLVAGAASP